MKWLFTLVTWIALAIAAAWFLDNSAMVSVFANGMRIDFSLNLLVIATLLGAWLILTIYRVRHRLGRMVREAKANRAQQAERDLMGLVMEALSLQLAGPADAKHCFGPGSLGLRGKRPSDAPKRAGSTSP